MQIFANPALNEEDSRPCRRSKATASGATNRVPGRLRLAKANSFWEKTCLSRQLTRAVRVTNLLDTFDISLMEA
jgi:hypothetical protein